VFITLEECHVGGIDSGSRGILAYKFQIILFEVDLFGLLKADTKVVIIVGNDLRIGEVSKGIRMLRHIKGMA
jgi:hypothetical protein